MPAVRRPACHRAWSVSALVIVLAACRRGDAPVAPIGPVRAEAGGEVAVKSTGPSGQVVTTAADEGLPEALALRRAQGMAAMDSGRFDRARQAFAEVLDVAPDNLATQVLHDAATQAMLAAQGEASQRFANLEAKRLPAPPWGYTLRRPAPIDSAPEPKLALVSETRNAITDDVEWLERNGLALPEYEVPNPMRGEPGALPQSIPPSFGKFLLVQAIHQDDYNILVYGPDYVSGRFVAVQRAGSGEIVGLFDFAAYMRAPGALAGERQFVEQSATWAALVGGVLYVSHGHRTYARSSKGDNAYITALDVSSGELLWRSAPLVANAANFIVHRGHIFTGYGFTDEPDHLYVLDAATGKAVGKTRLKSGPDYLFLKAGQLLVRCYDTDYVFELRQGGG